jgi:hypothetical protein
MRKVCLIGWLFVPTNQKWAHKPSQTLEIANLRLIYSYIQLLDRSQITQKLFIVVMFIWKVKIKITLVLWVAVLTTEKRNQIIQILELFTFQMSKVAALYRTAVNQNTSSRRMKCGSRTLMTSYFIPSKNDATWLQKQVLDRLYTIFLYNNEQNSVTRNRVPNR